MQIRLAALSLALVVAPPGADAYAAGAQPQCHAQPRLALPQRRCPPLLLAKKKAAKGKGGSPTKISTKGFGSAVKPAKGAAPLGRILVEPKYQALTSWLEGEGANLRKVGIADFDGLRGVIAMQELQPGEEIISIPAHCAVDLGVRGDDPVPAALELLQELEQDQSRGERALRPAYWETLPPPDSSDLSTPDFFSEKESMMLQWPPLVAESRQRSARLRKLLGGTAPSGDTPVEMLALAGGRLKQLKWATWLVQSRVLTVLGGDDGQGHKLMIPFLDMFNHKGTSRHYLTGRTDGSLRVVAGAKVAAGEQIFIVYGEADTSNAEFLGHYGFVDADCAAADAQLLASNPDAQAALAMTSLAEDEALLNEPGWSAMRPNEQLAVTFRMTMKRQLAKMERAASAGAAGDQ